MAQDEEAKKVFHLKENDITELSLVRGKAEVRLVKKDKEWRLAAPLEARADQTTVDSMLTTLARLRKEREIGGGKRPEALWPGPPRAGAEIHRPGAAASTGRRRQGPGDQNYYARQDQDPQVLMISVGSKDSLDRQLLALRDKVLLAFITDEVRA